MIPEQAAADITDELKLVEPDQGPEPGRLKIVQDDNGGIYGVPIDVFSVGLAYNRALFKQAGLDPDKPPTTWDEVRQYAKQITEKTGKAGYAQLTKDNTGGWMLTTMTYSMGGTVESEDGKKATFNDAPTKKALQLLKDMRWTDNAMGSNFLYNQEEVRQDFAAGKIGMVLQAPDAYDMCVKNFGMKPADYRSRRAAAGRRPARHADRWLAEDDQSEGEQERDRRGAEVDQVAGVRQVHRPRAWRCRTPRTRSPTRVSSAGPASRR